MPGSVPEVREGDREPTRYAELAVALDARLEESTRVREVAADGGDGAEVAERSGLALDVAPFASELEHLAVERLGA